MIEVILKVHEDRFDKELPMWMVYEDDVLIGGIWESRVSGKWSAFNNRHDTKFMPDLETGLQWIAATSKEMTDGLVEDRPCPTVYRPIVNAKEPSGIQ